MPVAYFFGSVTAFWFAASGWLIARALVAASRFLRADLDKTAVMRDEIIVATAIMHVLFVTIFFIADPMMSGIEAAVGAVGEFVAKLLPADGPIHDLWTDGIAGTFASARAASKGNIRFSFPVTKPKLITAMLVLIHAKNVR